MTPDYDVAIIGGGIQGVGVAQAAAAAGYKVILFEQQQLAAGTSSRSSKLIHGGLRYLESGQFGLVRKALLERALLLKLAPDLVRLVPFYIPVFPEMTRRGWQVRLGLSLYAALGNFSRGTRFKKLSEQVYPELALKKTASLQAVYQYYDAQTDDRALTLSVMHSAMQLGAELACPAEVLRLVFQKEQFVIGYAQQGKQCECRSRVVINAAGPWVNKVLALLDPQGAHLEMDLVQGTHLVLAENAPEGIYYVEAPQDQRAVFVMPWKGKTMIGTTETAYSGEPEMTRPLPSEKDYLLAVYRHYFVGDDSVVDSFSGLRVLPKTDHHFFYRPRDTILYSCPQYQNLLTLYGGKLTGYRATAQQVMKEIRPALPDTQKRADTSKLILSPVEPVLS